MDKKEQTRLRVQRYRNKKALHDSVTQNLDTVTQSPDSDTERSNNVTLYPPLLVALADIKKRAKLRAICESLNEHHLLPDVRYGVSGVTLDVIAELLTAF